MGWSLHIHILALSFERRFGLMGSIVESCWVDAQKDLEEIEEDTSRRDAYTPQVCATVGVS